MRKTHIYITAMIFLLTVAGFGCRGLSSEEQASIEPITLNYWTVFNDVGQLREFADQYQLQRPYVTVNIRQVRYDEFDDLFTNALADDIGPDIISTHVRWLRKYESRLSSMPSSVTVARIEQGGGLDKSIKVTNETVPLPTQRGIANNFIRTVADDVIIRDRVYGLPLAMDTLALYYNKTMLDAAGIPEPPRTWTDFLDTVGKLTKINASGVIVQSGVALGTGNNIENATDIFSLLLLQNGVTPMNETGVLFANGIERSPVGHPTLEALRFYTDFARPTKEVYSWNESRESARDAFARGSTAFYFGFAFESRALRARAAQLDIDVIPVPQLNEGAPVNVANYWVETVVRKSRHQDEAWDFIRFMTTPQSIEAYSERTGQPSPLRTQVAAQQEDPTIAPFARGVLTAKNWYVGRDSDAVGDIFADLFASYILPTPEGQNKLERDALLIKNAATRMQRTL